MPWFDRWLRLARETRRLPGDVGELLEAGPADTSSPGPPAGDTPAGHSPTGHPTRDDHAGNPAGHSTRDDHAGNPAGDPAGKPLAGKPAGDGEAAAARARHRFVLPAGAPFSAPEFTRIHWSRTMTTEDLVGLAGTYSGVITLPEPARSDALRLARSWLEEEPELARSGQVELPWRAVCWRTDRLD